MRFGRIKLEFIADNEKIDVLEAIREKEGLPTSYDLETIKLTIRILRTTDYVYTNEQAFCRALFNGVKECDVYINAPLIVNVGVKECELSNPVNSVSAVLIDYEF